MNRWTAKTENKLEQKFPPMRTQETVGCTFRLREVPFGLERPCAELSYYSGAPRGCRICARVKGASVTNTTPGVKADSQLPRAGPLAARSSGCVCDLPQLHRGLGPGRCEARPAGNLTTDKEKLEKIKSVSHGTRMLFARLRLLS